MESPANLSGEVVKTSERREMFLEALEKVAKIVGGRLGLWGFEVSGRPSSPSQKWQTVSQGGGVVLKTLTLPGPWVRSGARPEACPQGSSAHVYGQRRSRQFKV